MLGVGKKKRPRPAPVSDSLFDVRNGAVDAVAHERRDVSAKR